MCPRLPTSLLDALGDPYPALPSSSSPGRAAPCRGRAGRPAAGQPAGGLPAPEGAQGRGPGHRARGRHPPDLPAEPGGVAALRDQLDTFWNRALAGYRGRRRTTRQRGGSHDPDREQPSSVGRSSSRRRSSGRSPCSPNGSAISSRPSTTCSRVPIAETVFEPRGRRPHLRPGVDGSECRWARVLAYDPPDRVVFSWDIGPTGRSRPTRPTPARSRSASSPRPRAHAGGARAPQHRPARTRLAVGQRRRRPRAGWPLYLRPVRRPLRGLTGPPAADRTRRETVARGLTGCAPPQERRRTGAAPGGRWPAPAAALVLAALCLRGPFSAVGPVLDELATELSVSTAALAVVTSLPLICFGLVSPFAPAPRRPTRACTAAALVATAVIARRRSRCGSPVCRGCSSAPPSSRPASRW